MHARSVFLGVAALLLAGCGRFGLPGSGEAPDTAAVQQPPAAEVTAPAADSVGPSGAPPGPPAPQDSAADVAPVPADSVGAVLRSVAAGQAALAARLDSIDRRLAGGDPAGASGEGRQAGPRGPVLDEARDQVRGFGVGVFWSVIVLVVFNLLIRGLVWVLDALSERSATRRLFYKRLVPIFRIVLWVFAAYLIVSVIFQVDAQGVLAAAAAVGVAVGFAAQDLLKNLFGGLILVFDQPFQVGDKISVGGTYGEVVSIGLRSTRIVTADDNLVSVPNAQVVDGQVANANAGELNCQVVTDLYLPGTVDERQAKKIAFDAAASSKYVFLNKPIVVLVKDEFKETFLTRIRVKAYVLDPRYEFLFQSDVTERARAGFRDAGLVDPTHGRRYWVEPSEAVVRPEEPRP